MADGGVEAELDVEGIDDDCLSSLVLGIDPNELPSSSSHLSPELSQHPWLTFEDQFIPHIPSVVLHDDIDEVSRNTIQQMIEEEHSYLQKKKFMRGKTKGPKTTITPKKEDKSCSYNMRWTEKEKELFKRGIEKHGHKWKEVSDFIETRTHAQVKSFARNFLLSQTTSTGGSLQAASAQQPSRKLPSQHQEEQTVLQEAGEETDSVKPVTKTGHEDEEVDIEIDVEDNSEDDCKEPGGLQSALLFGDILRTCRPDEAVKSTSQADRGFDVSKTTLMPDKDAPLSQYAISSKDGSMSPRNENSSYMQHTSPGHCGSYVLHADAKQMSGNNKSDSDVGLGVNKDNSCSRQMASRQDSDSSLDDNSLMICLPSDERQAQKRRRRGKTAHTRKQRGKRQKQRGNESIVELAFNTVDSTEATPESGLPGNSEYDAQSALIGANQSCDFTHSQECKSGSHEKSTFSRKVAYEPTLSVRDKSDRGANSSNTFTLMRSDGRTNILQNKTDDSSENGKEGKTYEQTLQSIKVARGSEQEYDVDKSIGNLHVNTQYRTIAYEEEEAKISGRTLVLGQQISDPCLPKSAPSPDPGLVQDVLTKEDGPESITRDLSLSDAEGDSQAHDNTPQAGGQTCSLGSPCLMDGDSDSGAEGAKDLCDEGDDDDGDKEFEVSNQKGAPEPAVEEITLDLGNITSDEMIAHPEFFDYKSGTKTPERYMAIRNHIIKCWQKCKPGYLNKTTVRGGLRNAGDVNAIGSIHTYLESIGAINFGAYNPYHQRLKRRRSTVEKWVQQDGNTDAKIGHFVSTRPRRQVKPPRDDFETKACSSKPSEEKHKRVKMKHKRAPAYDPFKLIECSSFLVADIPVPFDVTVKGDVMVCMDLHSHLSTTEVIGLLGGHFDAQNCVLDVRLARPCRSLSTGMQCEMDPVSQTEASEEIRSVGCYVVGWYHSHPTFSCNPSIRDIETQANFQEWFSQDARTPFIGVIVSPYHSRQSVTSKINCLTVSKERSQEVTSWKPYKFDISVYQDQAVTQSHQQVINVATKLISEFAQYKYRVEMLWVCPGQSGMTYLEKMLQSISTHLCGNDEEKTETLCRLRQMIFDLFGTKCSNVIRDSALDVPLSFDASP